MPYKLFALILLVPMLFGCGGEGNDSPVENNRKPAVSFTLTALDGREYSLESVRGNVVLLDFWATWCPPCKKEIPKLISIWEKYRQKDFVLWGIGIDKPTALRSWSQEFGIPYPVLIGTRSTQSDYRVKAIPTVFIVDKSGRIAARFQGYREGVETQIEEEIDRLLGE